MQEGATRTVDYLGAALFTGALVPILLGLTNKQSGDWTDPAVGGLLAIGALVGLLFIFVESRAAEPIVPLHLFRNRSFAISVSAVFLAAFGFFATIVFLPRWFQVVNGSSATESGYQILPLLAGLIISAVTSGQLVSRTGRYKVFTLGALILLAGGLFLLTNLRADTPLPILWGWMFLTGIGVGPSFAVFTLIVQNTVPVKYLGTATSNLTFFQQVGGTVGLALTGTIFGTTLAQELPKQLAAGGVPPQISEEFARAGTSNTLGGVGDLGAAILAGIPAEFRAQVEPFIPAIVGAFNQAFSIATASTFILGIGAALIAAVLVVFLREEPMSDTVAGIVAARERLVAGEGG